MSELSDFSEGVLQAMRSGPIRVQLDASHAVSVVAIIQLACRHPGTRGSASRQQAETFARNLQSELAARAPELGRLLEQGWHPVFDVPSEADRS